MPYQFLHIETYARMGAHKRRSSVRKRSMHDIRDEMLRAPHACPHVAFPGEPGVLIGSPDQAFAIAAERALAAVDKVGRKLRCDSPVTLVGVVSWPDLVSEVTADPEKQAEYAFWRATTIAWLRDRWGDDLESVVEHLDELRPHLHFVVVPKLCGAGRLRMESVHPGKRAAAQCEDAGGTRREQKDAYIDAMIDLQHAYYEQVSVLCGLTRLGPRRQRLTRKEWIEQQRQAEALAEAHAKLETLKTEVRAKAVDFVNTRVAAVRAEAKTTADAEAKQWLQHIEVVKNAARRRVTDLDRETAELKRQLSVNNAINAAQAEELQLLRTMLEEHGIGLHMTLQR
ncbi:plasmid recombination protein [Bradyrhizobium sp. 192]|uniref:plasmid recombination protein n=1 Tax=Bradyrhizobium sp. 192 TaxID=2782660 RepID=UPI001FFEB44D|nr:plasmid recombination protein [Bradyrhizobium sp. 192]UPJ60301.1 hypothetical protein IVB24_12080 [Bradyrhizobium sp. 192]